MEFDEWFKGKNILLPSHVYKISFIKLINYVVDVFIPNLAEDAWNASRANQWVSVEDRLPERGSYLVKGILEGDPIIIEADFNAYRNIWTVELFQSYDPYYEEFDITVKYWMPIPPVE